MNTLECSGVVFDEALGMERIMGEIMQEHVDRLMMLGTLSAEEFTELLRYRNVETTEYLFQKAEEVRKQQFDKEVYLWGRLPFSNYCKNDCNYCGLRHSNRFVKRYRMNTKEILHYCHEAYRQGIRNFLLESGTDFYFSEANFAEIVDTVHKHFSDCTIILNVGDHTKAAYMHWMHSGAGAAMLSHDASNELQFKRLHSANMSLLRRKQGMWELQEMGYRTGTGFLVGTPYQTIENVSEDLLFMKQFMPHMIQIAPFLAAKHTPFERERGGNADMVLYLTAVARLMFRGSLLIADPSLEQAMHDGRRKALQAGANVIVVDIVDETLRSAYTVYDEHTLHRQQETIASLEQQIQESGYEVVRKAI